MRSPWFWISVGLHFFLFFSMGESEPDDPRETLVLPIEIQWDEKAEISKSTAGPVEEKKKGSARPSISLSKLKPNFLKNSYRMESPTKSAGAENEKYAGELQTWGSGAQDFSQILYYLSYEKLFHKIDGLIQYPALLMQHRIQGVVNLQLLIGPNGCRPFQHFKASNRYLGVYLKKLFQHKICKPEFLKQVLDAGEHRLDFSFTFELRESSLPPDPSPQRLQGNLLAYYRFAPASRLEWKLGPLRGIWGVPAVSVDFPWIFEQWSKHIEGVDPMDEYRD